MRQCWRLGSSCPTCSARFVREIKAEAVRHCLTVAVKSTRKHDTDHLGISCLDDGTETEGDRSVSTHPRRARQMGSCEPYTSVGCEALPLACRWRPGEGPTTGVVTWSGGCLPAPYCRNFPGFCSRAVDLLVCAGRALMNSSREKRHNQLVRSMRRAKPAGLLGARIAEFRGVLGFEISGPTPPVLISPTPKIRGPVSRPTCLHV